MNAEFLSREKGFLATCLAVCAASATATIHFCRSMSGGMAMPGGWTMSMAWMRMPGQSWLGVAGMFLGMWVMMMVAMMLPSLMPTLSGYRRALRGFTAHSGALTALAAAGYFFVWALIGIAACILGLITTATEMQSLVLARDAPAAMGFVLLLAGLFQLTPWKACRLARCQQIAASGFRIAGLRGTWRQGMSWGVECALCCLGLMAVLLVTGVMNLVVMAALALVIAVERTAPKPNVIARFVGIILIGAGAYTIAASLHAAHL